jgi:hypothetical protein
MYTLLELESKTFGELKKIGYELNVLPAGDRRSRQSWIDALVNVNPPLLQLLEASPAASVAPVSEVIEPVVEDSPAASVDPVSEPIEVQAQEAPIESKFGRIVYPRPTQSSIAEAAETSTGVEVDRVQEPIMETVETFPAASVEVNSVQDIINETWTYWEKEYCAWLADAKWCIHQGENKRIEKFLPACKTLRLEGMKVGAEYCAIWEVSECYYDFSGFPLPVSSSFYAQEPIAQAAETSPGVDVDRAQEPILETVETSPGVDLVDDELPGYCNCFGDGYVEDEFGFVNFCQCETEPRLGHQRIQRAIALAAKISLKPKSDRNPILTGIPLSDRFLARYSPPQSETLHYQLTDGYKVDTDGQLSLFEVQVVTEPEPPDPDDFESLDAFREAIALWEAQNPELLNVSLDSMCEWAPCPHEWYEPKAENLPLKASSMIELPEQSQVMELLRGCESCSDTSEFFIPTFGSLGDRFNRSDEPPDTGIFARLPKPKPPTFPPQSASQYQVSPSQPKSAQVSPSQSGIPKLSRNYPEAISPPGQPKSAQVSQVNQASRNYPETISKLFHRIAAGSSNQPARSPPGGDAMS